MACFAHVGLMKCSGGTYGKDSRVLHTAKLSQGFKVVSPGRTWQGAGISTTGTKIRVTGSEMRMAEAEVEQDEATIPSNQEICELVVGVPCK
jgi:hypothetical protein